MAVWPLVLGRFDQLEYSKLTSRDSSFVITYFARLYRSNVVVQELNLGYMSCITGLDGSHLTALVKDGGDKLCRLVDFALKDVDQSTSCELVNLGPSESIFFKQMLRRNFV